MLKKLLGSVFGTRHERERKRVQPIVDEIAEIGVEAHLLFTFESVAPNIGRVVSDKVLTANKLIEGALCCAEFALKSSQLRFQFAALSLQFLGRPRSLVFTNVRLGLGDGVRLLQGLEIGRAHV